MAVSTTNEGYVEMAKLLAGIAATPMTKIVLLKSNTVAETSTYAGVTKCTETGLAVASGACSIVTTTVSGDTSKVSVTFTPASGVSVTVSGHGGVNTDGDVLFGLCSYTAGIPLDGTQGDSLVATFSIQHKLGS
jgi:hypothetical protein